MNRSLLFTQLSLWHQNSAWGPVGVFLTVLSLFPPAPTLVKTLVVIVILAASAYAFFGGRASRQRITESNDPLWTQEQLTPPPVQGVLSHRTLPTQPQQTTPDIGETPVASAPPAFVYRLSDRIIGFIMYSVIFGLPGFLLVRSGVSWQHIVGIILLIFCGFAIVGGVFPESAKWFENLGNKLDALAYRFNRMASNTSEANRPQERNQE